MNLIFDWSGTLADDQRFTWRMTRDTVSHFGGPDVSYEACREEFCMPVDGFYGRYCPDAAIEEVDRYFFARYRNPSRGLRGDSTSTRRPSGW